MQLKLNLNLKNIYPKRNKNSSLELRLKGLKCMKGPQQVVSYAYNTFFRGFIFIQTSDRKALKAHLLRKDLLNLFHENIF